MPCGRRPLPSTSAAEPTEAADGPGDGVTRPGDTAARMIDAAGRVAPPALDPFELSRTVTQHCREAAGPVAILLRDIHGADAATLQILRQASETRANQAVVESASTTA